MNQLKVLAVLHYTLYFLFFTSLIFSFRFVSSICVGLMFLTGLASNGLSFKAYFQNKEIRIFLLGAFLFYIMHIVALSYTDNIGAGLDNLRIKAGLLITALAVCFSAPILKNNRERLLFHFCLCVLAAGLYCGIYACVQYYNTGDLTRFFYHSLVAPIGQHAIYFSILVFIGWLFLLEELRLRKEGSRRPVYVGLVFFFSFFLLLLSSKLVIILCFIYLIYSLVDWAWKNKTKRLFGLGLFIVFALLAGLLLFTNNPVKNRFYEITRGDIGLVNQDRFSQGTYFNGLQFRVLQWKWVGQILNEKQGWVKGLGPGDAQPVLDQLYISKDMYQGIPGTTERGFLGYNTHNQFLETVLQTGLIGLCFLLLLCFALIKMAFLKRKRIFSFVIILVIAWFFNESVLETQYGNLIFAFFPLFLFFSDPIAREA